MRDMYDKLPPRVGAHLRRKNLERLAKLESEKVERQARIRRVMEMGGKQA